MDNLEMVKFIYKALDAKKAEEIKILQIDKISSVADYFVIAGATSTTHLNALSDELEMKLKEQGVEPLHRDGMRSGSWAVLDYISIMVHIFNKESRQYYSLEKMWSEGTEIFVEE